MFEGPLPARRRRERAGDLLERVGLRRPVRIGDGTGDALPSFPLAPTSGLVQGEWPWQAVLQGSTLAGIMVLAGALFSTYRIARLRPLDALRGR